MKSSSEQGLQTYKRFRTRFIQIIAAIGLVYIMSQFLRTANGVIAKDLVAEFGLSAEELGILTGSFFLSFAIVQIPVGILFDRYGPRLVMPSILLFAIAGSIIFSLSNSFFELLLARLMMGIGVAPVLMGALFLFGRWVNSKEYSSWMGRMIAIGGVGAMLSATPLAWVAESFGWRSAFIGVGLVIALGAVFIWFFVRDHPPSYGDISCEKRSQKLSQETFWENICGMRDIFKTPNLWPILGMAFVSYPVTITIIGLWGAPWLMDVYGIKQIDAGNILLWVAIALIVSSISIGYVEKILNIRKWLVIVCSMGVGISLSILAIWPKPPLEISAALLIFIGFLSAYNIIIAGHGRSLFPDHLAGRGMSLIGIALMGGPFIMQSITGLIIGAFDNKGSTALEFSGEPYRAAYGFLAIIIVLANLLYSRIPDKLPSSGFATNKNR